jgi:CRP-like cAMP-binding protein
MKATFSSWSKAAFEVVSAVIGAGGHFGEISAIDGLARSASVAAIEDCLLAALPPTQFEALIRDQPEIAIELLRGLVRIIRTDERLIELSTFTTRLSSKHPSRALAAAQPSAPSRRVLPSAT